MHMFMGTWKRPETLWSVGFALVYGGSTLFFGWLLPGSVCHSLTPDVCGLVVLALLGLFLPNSSFRRKERQVFVQTPTPFLTAWPWGGPSVLIVVLVLICENEVRGGVISKNHCDSPSPLYFGPEESHVLCQNYITTSSWKRRLGQILACYGFGWGWLEGWPSDKASSSPSPDPHVGWMLKKASLFCI